MLCVVKSWLLMCRVWFRCWIGLVVFDFSNSLEWIICVL